MEKHVVRPALCLDMDGTIRRSKAGNDFIRESEDIELMPGIEELIYAYKAKGYLILIFTNQGGVAFGYDTFDHVNQMLFDTVSMFRDNTFDALYPSYSILGGTVAPYQYRSLLRKPNIGMLAIAEVDAMANNIIIDWDASLFVGDRDADDRKCAENAQIKYMDIQVFLTTPVPSDED